jgi:hypothetical protein
VTKLGRIVEEIARTNSLRLLFPGNFPIGNSAAMPAVVGAAGGMPERTADALSG